MSTPAHDKNTEEIILKSKLILRNEIDIIEGVRFIVDNRFNLKIRHDDIVFRFLIGVVSDTEEIPSAVNRANYSPIYLDRIDSEKEEYISRVLEKIKDSCLMLVKILE